MEKPIELLLVDDHSLFRLGLAELLRSKRNIHIAGQAINGAEAVKQALQCKPDVILMDVQMPVCGGVEATRTLRESGYKGGILMFTISERDEDLFNSLKNGANGYILKNAELEELINAIISISNGETAISPHMATRLLGEFRLLLAGKNTHLTNPETLLSQREEEVLKLAAGGSSNREIAEKLLISENTVKSHMSAILEKLHLKSRYEVIRYAMHKGLVSI